MIGNNKIRRPPPIKHEDRRTYATLLSASRWCCKPGRLTSTSHQFTGQWSAAHSQLLLQFHHDRTLGHAFTSRNRQISDHPRLMGLHRVLHLHGLQNHHDFALGDLLAFLHIHLNHGALHRGGHGITRNTRLRTTGTTLLCLLLSTTSTAASQRQITR